MDAVALCKENVNFVCRTCFRKTEPKRLYSIYDEIQDSQNNKHLIHDVLIDISKSKMAILKNSVDLPTCICKNCVIFLKSILDFKQQCKRIESILDKYAEELPQAVVVMGKEEDSCDVDVEGVDDPLALSTDVKGTALIEHRSIESDKFRHVDKFYKCTVCGQAFSFKYYYEKHLKKHELLGDDFPEPVKKETKPIVCHFCSTQFATEEMLSLHLKAHEDQEKPFRCTVCNKAFPHRNNLTKHMYIHTKTRSQLCNICGETLSDRTALARHLIRKHSNERPYKCNECEKTFSSTTTLRDHQVSHSALRLFKCSVCQYGFKRKSQLHRHEKVHSKISSKSQLCVVCGKCFKASRNLQKHMLEHQGLLM